MSQYNSQNRATNNLYRGVQGLKRSRSEQLSIWWVLKQTLLHYFFFLLFCILMKPLFIIVNAGVIGAGFVESLRIIWAGLPLDLGVAGYLSLLPTIFLLLSLWTKSKFFHGVVNAYYILIFTLLFVLYGMNLILYPFWGFPLDSTPLFYFFSSPKDAAASVPLWQFILPFVACVFLVWGLFKLMRRWLIYPLFKTWKPAPSIEFKLTQSLFALLLTAMLILPIRGGVTTSTLNVGFAYYSDHAAYNHAAVNPCFSLLESLTHESDFGNQYRYMSEEKAKGIYTSMQDTSSWQTSKQVLNTTRPNVIFIQLESFMARAMESIGEWPNIEINLNRMGEEGILFRNFYANSFRTDRGQLALMSGFPAQPTTSAMKYPRVTASMPAFTEDLKHEGYQLKFYYGGDINFTNLHSYLNSHGFSDKGIICDADFPRAVQGKWGAPDHLLFQKAFADLKARDVKSRAISSADSLSPVTSDTSLSPSSSEPFLYYMVTSSSHEPFDVPFYRLPGKEANALAYADSCLGAFVDSLRTLPLWDNTLIIMVADHTLHYPKNLDNQEPLRYHIPCVWVGGALLEPKVVDTYACQSDLSATLLSQLHLSHSDYVFSKDIFNPNAPHFAFFTFPDLFGLMDSTGYTVYNNSSQKVFRSTHEDVDYWVNQGKGYLQSIYDALQNYKDPHETKE